MKLRDKIKLVLEDKKVEDKIKSLIERFGLDSAIKTFGGLQNLAKALKVSDEEVLNEFLVGQTFKTSDFANQVRVGGYDFEFQVEYVSVEDGSLSEFYMSDRTVTLEVKIVKGQVDLIMTDGGVYNLFDKKLHNSSFWWEVSNEIEDIIGEIMSRYLDEKNIVIHFNIYKNQQINEVRVPRDERVELYKDENIIVVVPLTHRALQKYAHQCQWCINDDKHEWSDYHQGRHAVIIQRKPKKVKMGMTGNPIPSEIFIMGRWDEGGYKFKDVCDILGYQFKDETEMTDYYVTVSNDINNFATNIVYYSPENGIYDMEDNFLWNFNYEISDIPNVTPEVIKIMDDYLFNV